MIVHELVVRDYLDTLSPWRMSREEYGTLLIFGKIGSVCKKHMFILFVSRDWSR